MRVPLRLLAALAVLLAQGACSLPGPLAPPLPPAATRALDEAQELQRLRPAGWEERAAAAVARASEAAPDWVAPRRMADDLAREALVGHEALARRLEALEDGASAAELYLAGRLEGEPGFARIERAARMDPRLAWAWHGTAWNLFLAGDARGALRPGRRAVNLARGAHETGVFVGAEARYLAALGREDEARARLDDVLADATFAGPARTELEVSLARLELRAEEREVVERGYWRALALLEAGRIGEVDVERLGDDVLLRRGRLQRPDPLAELHAALARGAEAGGAPERYQGLQARVLDLEGAHALASVAWERSRPAAADGGAYRRVRDLERGAAELALERWRAALPGRLLGDDGLPRDERLRALVLAARAADGTEGALRLGEALVAAGWFDEAAAWASALAADAPDAALALRARAAEGQALLAGIRGLLGAVDEGREPFVGAERGVLPVPRPVDDLDALLEGVQALLERSTGAPLAFPLRDSPRIGYGALASIVHPGPFFSELDEQQGRGHAGEPVPGLAAELARLGRFGIFGEAPGGGGPDGAVLRVVGGEWLAGEHLGVPYAGHVAWCEGADVESRPGRAGSRISGAALHEGYWIDLDVVRQDHARTAAIEREWFGDEAGRARVERALATRGPRVPQGAGPDENTRWLSPLGEGERVLLAVLSERAAPADGGSRVSLDEALALTARHEEGHLTDRTRFLPLARHWGRVLRLVLRHGLSPRAVSRALEYRAQLVALCVADEPRLALADCLASAEGAGAVLPHGEAYQELVAALLRVAGRELERLPALDPERYVLYQLHRLSGEEVRRLALLLAADEGMVE